MQTMESGVRAVSQRKYKTLKLSIFKGVLRILVITRRLNSHYEAQLQFSYYYILQSFNLVLKITI